MADTKFTPAPWIIRHTSQGFEIACPGGGWLFELYDRPDRAAETDADFIASQEANAALIAAAPDLYEALRECGDQIALLAKNPDTNPWVQQAMAALAKARGEPA